MDLSAMDITLLTDEIVIRYTVIGILVHLICFHSIYYIILPYILHPIYPHIKNNKSIHFEIANRGTSLLHGCIILVSYTAIFGWDLLCVALRDEHVYAITTDNQRALFAISAGYFIYDTINSTIIYSLKIDGNIRYIWTLHHIIGIASCIIGIIMVHSGYIGILCVFYGELNNPLLHLPIIVSKCFVYPLVPTLGFVICKILYLVTFIFIRLGLYSVGTVQLFTSYSNASLTYRYMSLFHLLMPLLFMPALVRSTYRITIKYNKTLSKVATD